jgi:methylaspartate ammonia-lyase
VPARRCPSTPRAASSKSSRRRSATKTPAWPYRAARHFFVCVEQHQIGELVDIEPIHVAAYIGALQDTAAKLHVAANSMLFGWLLVRSWPTE